MKGFIKLHIIFDEPFPNGCDFIFDKNKGLTYEYIQESINKILAVMPERTRYTVSCY